MTNDSQPSAEYGLDHVRPQDRSFGFADTLWTWFGSGVNTGSWYFGGLAAALGMSFVLKYSLLWLPLMMIPWAAVGYIGYRFGASTVATTRPCLGIAGSRVSGIAEFLVLIGWPSVNSFIAAISMTYVFHVAFGWPTFGQPGGQWPLVLGILATAVVQGLVMTMGHESIRYLERVAVLLLLLLGGWVTYVVVRHWDFARIMSFSLPEAPHPPAFYIDLAFGFNWVWAQIADFSRFAKSGKAATVGSWLGISIGQGWFMLVGALGVIGVALQTGAYDPNNSDPSSVLAALGLGTVAFLVLILSTISTNVTVLYGSAMGIVGMLRSRNPRKILVAVAVLQLFLCFLPLAFSSFIHYFESFLTVIGGLFIPLWTIVVLDYYWLRRMQLRKADIFPDQAKPGEKENTLSQWNIDGFISMALGLAVFYTLSYILVDVAAVTTASIPTIIVSGIAYLLLQSKKRNKPSSPVSDAEMSPNLSPGKRA